VDARAASWNGLEPFVSKRADVERVLGRPSADRLAKDASLQFEIPEGAATIFFVTPKFILIQHASSTATPGSMKLIANLDFEWQMTGTTQIYSNPKDGIYHTFVDSLLKTTRYSFSAAQITRLQNELKPKSP
jgi:hypothetical protein